ncbi:hypothetical protein D3C73_278200 [compost metagenome]
MLNIENGTNVLIHYTTMKSKPNHSKVATFIERDNEGNNHFFDIDGKFSFSDSFIDSGQVVIEVLDED